ncbi:MAG: Ig-like domain-containing protein [Planctomycetota bacterium]|nr:MAG: Ig-like domain-containing protein [Planctomycetota bacterium]
MKYSTKNIHISLLLICLCFLLMGQGGPCTPSPPQPTGCLQPSAPAGSFAVVSTSPCDKDVNVPTETTIRVTFNGSADPSTLGGVIRPQVDLVLQWSNNNTQVDIQFANPLQANTTYTFIVNAVFDTNGNSLYQTVQVCFSTGSTLGECHTSLSCQQPSVTDPNVSAFSSYNYSPFFASNSFWNTPIGSNPQIDQNSSTMIDRFNQVVSQFSGIWLGFDHDVVPIYFADANTPQQNVTLTALWSPITTRSNVPIPSHALPDCGDDNFMSILDTVNNVFYDFWQVTKQSDGSWSGSWVSSPLAANGDGSFPGTFEDAKMGVRVSQFPLATGLVWPHELSAGKIEHALVFAYNFTRSGVYSTPAKGTDGANNDLSAIPIGALLQLDPSLNLDTLNLTAYEKVIANALQNYGMYLGDSGGGISISLVHPYSFAGNPYTGLLPDSVITEGGILLDKIPADRFRVLQMNLVQAN